MANPPRASHTVQPLVRFYGVNSTNICIVSTFRPSSRIAFWPSLDCSNSRNFPISGISAKTPVTLKLLGSRKLRHLIPSFPNISCRLPGPFFQALAQTAPSLTSWNMIAVVIVDSSCFLLVVGLLTVAALRAEQLISNLRFFRHFGYHFNLGDFSYIGDYIMILIE